MDRTTLLRRLALRYRRRFFDLAYALPVPGLTLYNLGVAPVPDHVLGDPQGRSEPHQIALYDLVAVQVEAGRPPPGRIVELSAGKGAGAAYLRRRLGAEVLALEPSAVGRLWARLRFGVEARHALAPALPLESGSAAALVSVEAAHNYMTPAFAVEAFRVLAPGGVLVVADFPPIPPERQRADVPAWLTAAGFRMRHFEDITAGVVAACAADAPRKRRIFRYLPGPIRREALTSFSVERSPRLEGFRDGSRGYYLAAAVKP